MNLKNIGSDGLAKNCIVDDGKFWKMENHENTFKNHKINQKPWNYMKTNQKLD